MTAMSVILSVFTKLTLAFVANNEAITPEQSTNFTEIDRDDLVLQVKSVKEQLLEYKEGEQLELATGINALLKGGIGNRRAGGSGVAHTVVDDDDKRTNIAPLEESLEEMRKELVKKDNELAKKDDEMAKKNDEMAKKDQMIEELRS